MPYTTNLFDLSEPAGAVPHGVEALFEYEGLVLNDRSGPDRYRIISVAGLADADLRDTRENQPGGHGEIPLESFYGGRTIVLTGRIEAGNLNKLRRMEEDLMVAFGGLEDSPLTIRRFSYKDNFSINKLATDYFYDANSGTMTVANGVLSLTTASNKHLLYKDFTYRDAQVEAKINVPAFDASGFYGLIQRRQDVNNFLTGAVDTNAIEIWKRDGGAWTKLNFAPLPLSAGMAGMANKPGWLIFTAEGNTLIAEWRTTQDVEGTKVTHELAGADAIQFGTGIQGHVGIYSEQSVPTVTYDDLHIRAIDPPDIYVDARKNAPLAIEEEQKSFFFHRDFQITLRAFKPEFKSLVSHSRSLVPVVPPGSQRGRTYEKNTNYHYSRYVDPITGLPASFGNSFFVNNRGNFESPPIIKINGLMSSAVLTNVTNGLQISLDADVLDGNTLIVDVEDGTAIDESGKNILDAISPSSDYFLLDPGMNEIQVAFNEAGANGKIHIEWQDRWK